jgi:hypothetical protein
MAHVGNSKIRIDGMEKELRYNMRALAALEKLEGKAIGALFAEDKIMDNLGINFLANAICVGLQWANKSVTPGKVLDMMDFANESEGYYMAVTEGITDAMGANKKKDKEGDLPLEQEDEAGL